MSWIKNSYNTVEENSSQRKKQQQFGWLVSFIISLILSLSFYKNGFIFDFKQSILIGVFVSLSIMTLIVPKIFYYILIIWLFIGLILGEISSFIVMGILYYCFMSPIAYFLQLKKKDKEEGWIDKNNKIDYKKLS
jgi:hypothetical protein